MLIFGYSRSSWVCPTIPCVPVIVSITFSDLVYSIRSSVGRQKRNILLFFRIVLITYKNNYFFMTAVIFIRTLHAVNQIYSNLETLFSVSSPK